MGNEVINECGVILCPNCGSRRITEILQATLTKMYDANSGRIINPYTGKGYMSNRDKAMAYDASVSDSIGCWAYKCRKCGWESRLYTE